VRAATRPCSNPTPGWNKPAAALGFHAVLASGDPECGRVRAECGRGHSGEQCGRCGRASIGSPHARTRRRGWVESSKSCDAQWNPPGRGVGLLPGDSAMRPPRRFALRERPGMWPRKCELFAPLPPGAWAGNFRGLRGASRASIARHGKSAPPEAARARLLMMIFRPSKIMRRILKAQAAPILIFEVPPPLRSGGMGEGIAAPTPACSASTPPRRGGRRRGGAKRGGGRVYCNPPEFRHFPASVDCAGPETVSFRRRQIPSECHPPSNSADSAGSGPHCHSKPTALAVVLLMLDILAAL